MSAPQTPAGRLWARWGLDPVAGLVEGLALEWAAGRFTRAERSPRPPRDYGPRECFPDHFVTPGLLNAHVHLDYSFLAGALPGGQGFAPWLRAMIAARRAFGPGQEPAARAACARSNREMMQDGVTEAWDISSYGWAREAWPAGLRGISFEEFIAARREGWRERWEGWREKVEGKRDSDRDRDRDTDYDSVYDSDSDSEYKHDRRNRIVRGVSAHAPYTVCPPALEAVARWANENEVPLAIHLAESPEENAMLMQGEGALLELLSGLTGADLRDDLGVGRSPIARAEAAGALGPRTLAIHCNLPQPGEVERLAASGASVVFCPSSHAFFGYPSYPLNEYRRAGARLALGTDSLASNGRLSIREEMRTLAALAPDWAPLDLLACATGAMLGTASPFAPRGRLLTGYPAQWAVWRQPGAAQPITTETLLNALTAEATPLESSSAIAP